MYRYNTETATLDPDQIDRLVFLTNNMRNLVGPFDLLVSAVFWSLGVSGLTFSNQEGFII